MKNIQFIKFWLIKNKNIILAVLVIILVFYLLNSYTTVVEGFGSDNIGKFKYLAPDASGNTRDPDTINKFVDKYNSVNNLTGDKAMKASTFDSKNMFVQNALQKEAEYYIQNGHFPYCSYITDNFIPILQKRFPNRLAYAALAFMGGEAQDPPTQAYQIFEGKEPEPPDQANASSAGNTFGF